MEITTDPMNHLVLAGGRIIARRCQATSKRTHERCGAPAERGKATCRFHGGRSTGPLTTEGRARVVAAHFKHGRRSAAHLAAKRKTRAVLVLAAKLMPLLNRLAREGRDTVSGAELLAAGLTPAEIMSFETDTASGEIECA
jgi:hypothetical protein